VAETLSPREEIVAPAAAAPQDVAEVSTGSGKTVEVKPVVAKAADKALVMLAEAKPAAKPAEAGQDAARALSILEGKPAAAGPKFVVQVTALASQAKVIEVQEKLKEAGIKSYTQKVPTQSGELIRVRVGPLSKDEAEKVRAKLVKIGMSGSMVPV
jgi:DedD protein